MAFWLAVPPLHTHPSFLISLCGWGGCFTVMTFSHANCLTFHSLTFKNNYHSIRQLHRGQGDAEEACLSSSYKCMVKYGEMNTWARVACDVGDLHKSGCLCNGHHSFQSRVQYTVLKNFPLSLTGSYTAYLKEKWCHCFRFEQLKYSNIDINNVWICRLVVFKLIIFFLQPTAKKQDISLMCWRLPKQS